MQLSPKEFAEKVTFLVLSFNFKTFTVKYESSCKYQVLNSISSIYLFKSCFYFQALFLIFMFQKLDLKINQFTYLNDRVYF